MSTIAISFSMSFTPRLDTSIEHFFGLKRLLGDLKTDKLLLELSTKGDGEVRLFSFLMQFSI